MISGSTAKACAIEDLKAQPHVVALSSAERHGIRRSFWNLAILPRKKSQ
jgi:hypothetical protein